MEFKLYKCNHCGNIAFKVIDKGTPLSCCGEPMVELKAGETDGAIEKHVPVVEKTGNQVTVKVGAVPHPMEEKHYIPIITAVNENTAVIKLPKPGDQPVLNTQLEGDVTAYAWCNLHGYWTGK